LRQAVNDWLRRCPQVKSHRLGQYGEGDTGVTVVELK
ncbi:MAG: Smr/MutS family protein, partial [Oscillospiraceae bacterium]|nr:Smr/MutS family protein [Oscillospiraceae bacterium]MBP0969505.1 Smr/MutS family protein [Oscillospiraceae bacterium]